MENKNWFDKYYKLLMVVPILVLIFCLFYLNNFYRQNNDFILKDSSLSGGTVITIHEENIDYDLLENSLKQKYPDISFRKLTNLRTGEITSFIIETPRSPEEVKPAIEEIIQVELTEDNSSIEFTGPSLSKNFYNQLVYALILSFVLMSLVVIFMFRTFIPSLAMIFSVFANMIFALTVVNIIGLKLSAAGIAAFLMLIGYSVDSNILLTTRALKKKEGTLNQRIFGAFKVGIFMTLTALSALIPSFFIISNLPDSFRQIFLVLSFGLIADIINTWATNTGIIKWYCIKKGIN